MKFHTIAFLLHDPKARRVAAAVLFALSLCLACSPHADAFFHPRLSIPFPYTREWQKELQEAQEKKAKPEEMFPHQQSEAGAGESPRATEKPAQDDASYLRRENGVRPVWGDGKIVLASLEEEDGDWEEDSPSTEDDQDDSSDADTDDGEQAQSDGPDETVNAPPSSAPTLDRVPLENVIRNLHEARSARSALGGSEYRIQIDSEKSKHKEEVPLALDALHQDKSQRTNSETSVPPREKSSVSDPKGKGCSSAHAGVADGKKKHAVCETKNTVSSLATDDVGNDRLQNSRSDTDEEEDIDPQRSYLGGDDQEDGQGEDSRFSSSGENFSTGGDFDDEDDRSSFTRKGFSPSDDDDSDEEDDDTGFFSRRGSSSEYESSDDDNPYSSSRGSLFSEESTNEGRGFSSSSRGGLFLEEKDANGDGFNSPSRKSSSTSKDNSDKEGKKSRPKKRLVLNRDRIHRHFEDVLSFRQRERPLRMTQHDYLQSGRHR